jgi:hypothetical protein
MLSRRIIATQACRLVRLSAQAFIFKKKEEEEEEERCRDYLIINPTSKLYYQAY